MLDRFKRFSLIQKLIIFIGLPCAALFACSTFCAALGFLAPDRSKPTRIVELAQPIEPAQRAAPVQELTSAPTDTPIPTIALPPATQPPTSTTTQVVADTPTPTVADAPVSDGLQEAQVVNVVDGDTIDVVINGVEYRVRYILVDTPETKHPTKPVQPFGPEASEANRQLVEGKTVRLEKDVSETDRYGRLLRYVYVGDMMVNEELLRLGLAQVATFPPDVKYVDRFLAVQREAQAAGVGLWGGEPVAEQPVPTIAPVPVDPQPVATEPPTEPQPAPAGGGVVITNIFYDGAVKQVESDEYVEITNQSAGPVDISNWKINAGDPGQDFIFPQGFVMQPGQTCRVYTNETHPESCGFSFGSGKAIWNNKGDVGVLYDAQGQPVSEKGY